MAPTVRFSTPAVNDRHGILKTDGRRQPKNPPESERENGDDNKFILFTLSTIVLLCAIVALTYRGYLDTRAVNYPYQGSKVFHTFTINTYT